MTLFVKALQSPYTAKTFQTLTKHSASASGFDSHAALRLLRRNVRDVAPAAPFAVQHDIARQLLNHWRNLGA
jgi:hypothetical protein